MVDPGSSAWVEAPRWAHHRIRATATGGSEDVTWMAGLFPLFPVCSADDHRSTCGPSHAPPKKRNNKNTEWMQNRYAPNGVVPAETGPAQPDGTAGGSPNAHAGRNPTDRPPPPAGQASGHRRATGRALRRCPPPHHHPSRRGGTSGAQWWRTVPPQPVPPGRPWNTTGQREPRWPDGQSHSRDGRSAPTRGAGRRRTRSRTTRPGQPAHASTNGTDQRH